MWGIGVDKVRGWIRSGELPAIDASARRGGRPRFLIDRADIAVFEAKRAVAKAPARARARRRKQSDVEEYF
jgi:hypothetical protein